MIEIYSGTASFNDLLCTPLHHDDQHPSTAITSTPNTGGCDLPCEPWSVRTFVVRLVMLLYTTLCTTTC